MPSFKMEKSGGRKPLLAPAWLIIATRANTFDQERPKTSKRVVEAILESEVVLGPGSLFTSILPNLMIDETGKTILETKAQVAYVCNIMTQRGETEHFTDDHVAVLHKHLGEKHIDTVLVNINQVPQLTWTVTNLMNT